MPAVPSDDAESKRSKPVRSKSPPPAKPEGDAAGASQSSDPSKSAMRSVPRPVRPGQGPAAPAAPAGKRESVMKSVPKPMRRPRPPAEAKSAPPPPRKKRTTSNVEDTAIITPDLVPAADEAPRWGEAPSRRSPDIASPDDEVAQFKKREEHIAARMSAQAKRSQQRVEVDLDVPVIYKFVATGEADEMDRIYEGRLRDVSTGGLQFIGKLDPALTPYPLLAGEDLMGLNLCLPFSERPVKVLGRAVRVEPSQEEPGEYLYGVKLVDPSEGVKTAINSFLITLQIGARKRLQR